MIPLMAAASSDLGAPRRPGSQAGGSAHSPRSPRRVAEAAVAPTLQGLGGQTFGDDGVLSLLLREREKTCEAMSEWIAEHRSMYEAHVAQQERLLQVLLDAHRKTLDGLAARKAPVASREGTALAKDWLDATVPDSVLGGRGRRERPSGMHAEEDVPLLDRKMDTRSASDEERDFTAEILPPPEGEELSKGQEQLEWWKRCSGLHTVQDWVQDYKRHPAGWAALLMIHGVPEITSRLRSKVENYAIYAALFLSMSVALLVDPPDDVTATCPDGDRARIGWWLCRIEKRAYFLSFMVGTASHMLSILLAMAFNNVLNEAARDSDVFRLFAKGQGFRATLKCQTAFFVGCAADFLAVAIRVAHYVGWEAVAVAVVITAGVMKVLMDTEGLLDKSAGIRGYWRTHPEGDPYELEVPVRIFGKYADANRAFFMASDDSASVAPRDNFAV